MKERDSRHCVGPREAGSMQDSSQNFALAGGERHELFNSRILQESITYSEPRLRRHYWPKVKAGELPP